MRGKRTTVKLGADLCFVFLRYSAMAGTALKRLMAEYKRELTEPSANGKPRWLAAKLTVP